MLLSEKLLCTFMVHVTLRKNFVYPYGAQQSQKNSCSVLLVWRTRHSKLLAIHTLKFIAYAYGLNYFNLLKFQWFESSRGNMLAYKK